MRSKRIVVVLCADKMIHHVDCRLWRVVEALGVENYVHRVVCWRSDQILHPKKNMVDLEDVALVLVAQELPAMFPKWNMVDLGVFARHIVTATFHGIFLLVLFALFGVCFDLRRWPIHRTKERVCSVVALPF